MTQILVRFWYFWAIDFGIHIIASRWNMYIGSNASLNDSIPSEKAEPRNTSISRSVELGKVWIGHENDVRGGRLWSCWSYSLYSVDWRQQSLWGQALSMEFCQHCLSDGCNWVGLGEIITNYKVSSCPFPCHRLRPTLPANFFIIFLSKSLSSIFGCLIFLDATEFFFWMSFHACVLAY